MSVLRKALFACLAVTALTATSAAQADQWQKSTDGYWYYWSDSSARWFYTDGKTWQAYRDGKWIDSGSPPVGTRTATSSEPVRSYNYSSYYYEPSGSSGRSWSYSGAGHR
jgi:hypothetical protein